MQSAAGCSEWTGQVVSDVPRSASAAELYDAANDQLQTGSVDAQDKDGGQSCIPGVRNL